MEALSAGKGADPGVAHEPWPAQDSCAGFALFGQMDRIAPVATSMIVVDSLQIVSVPK
jgi:hypothetical protein